LTEDDFEVPVSYKGKTLSFTARLISGRYAYKIELAIDEIHVNFERDDEGSWRATLSENDLQKNHSIDRGLLQAISESIEEILR